MKHSWTNQEKKRTLWAAVVLPTVYAVLCFGILAAALSPFYETIGSLYRLLCSDVTQTSQLDNSLYNGEKVLHNGQIPLSSVTMPVYEQEYGRIRIDSVGINLPLYFGDSPAALKLGAGQYLGSAIPGYGKPILIAAHCTKGYFHTLPDVKKGDLVTIETAYGTFEYEVTGWKETKANDKSAYDLSRQEENLTLYTCYPVTFGYQKTRYFVYAKKVSGPTIVAEIGG